MSILSRGWLLSGKENHACFCSRFLSSFDVLLCALCIGGSMFVSRVIRLCKDRVFYIRFFKLHREPLPWCKSVRHKSEYPFTNWQKGQFNIGTSITGCYDINIDSWSTFTFTFPFQRCICFAWWVGFFLAYAENQQHVIVALRTPGTQRPNGQHFVSIPASLQHLSGPSPSLLFSILLSFTLFFLKSVVSYFLRVHSEGW